MRPKLWLIAAALLLTTGFGLYWIARANTDLPPHWGQPAFSADLSILARQAAAPYDARVLAVEGLAVQLVIFGVLLWLIARELTLGKFAGLLIGALTCLAVSPFGPRLLPLTSGLAALLQSRPGALDGQPAISFGERLTTLLPWGAAGVVWAAILCVPAVALSLSTVEKRDGQPFDPYRILSFLALACVAGVPILAAHGASPAAATELLFAAVLLNSACLIARPRYPIWSALWFIVVLVPLIDPSPVPGPVLTGPALESSATAQLRQAVADGKMFADPAVQRVLPESIRPAMSVSRSGGSPLSDADKRRAAASTFDPQSIPNLDGRDGLPAWGTWSAAGAPYPTGEFTSAPLTARSAMIQIRVAGELRPPDTELFLLSDDGQISRPLSAPFSAESRWRRINFKAPKGAFQIVAVSRSPAHWLAFTAPQEIYERSRLANKLVQTWPYWLAAGLVLSLAFGFSLPQKLPPSSPTSSDGLVAEAARAFVPRSLTEPESPGGFRYASIRMWLDMKATSLAHLKISPALLRATPWLSLLAYGLLLSHHLDTTAGPNDSGGYLNSAKLLASHHTTAPPRLPLPNTPTGDLAPYLPGTFVATPDGRLAPTYPVGFPLIIAAVAQILPLSLSVPVVILVQICLGVALTYLLAREMDLSPGWAWFAAAIIGLSPVYLFQALQPQSDGPALVWVTAAIYLAWTSARQPSRALAAGFATALAVLIRPSNTLCVLPLLVCFAGHWRQLRLWILGGIPGAVFQLWYNHRLYGHPLSTGYGDANDVGTGFGLRFVPLTLHAYARWLPAFFTPLVLLALAGPWLPSLPRRARLVLAVWAAVFATFYTFYWCTYDNWYNMRFVLPAAPALVILGLWTARWLANRLRFPFGLRAAVVCTLLALLVNRSADERVFYWMAANRVNADAAEWARDHLPANAVVVGRHITGPLFYYSNLAMVRTDSASAQSPAFYADLARAGRPVYALTFHWERRGFHWGNGKGDGYPDAPGPWTHLATIGDQEVHAWIRQ